MVDSGLQINGMSPVSSIIRSFWSFYGLLFTSYSNYLDYVGICNFAGTGFRNAPSAPAILHCLFFATVARNYLALSPCLINPLSAFDT